MNISDLHEQVSTLFTGPKSSRERSLIHAMIDLGHITEFVCSWEHCVLPGVPLGPSHRGKRRDSVTFDHTLARVDGGTDHWSNLRLMHHTCNMRKSHAFGAQVRERISDGPRDRWKNDPAYREQMIDGAKARWADPEYNERVSDRIREALNTDEMRQRRSESMRRHWADPEKRAKRLNNYPRGDAWHEARGGQS
jgi:hypothetical protein